MTDEQAQVIARCALELSGLDDAFIRRHQHGADFAEAMVTVLHHRRKAFDDVVAQNQDLRIRLDERKAFDDVVAQNQDLRIRLDEARKILAMRGTP